MVNVIVSDDQVLRDGDLRLDGGESAQVSFIIQDGFHYSTALRNHGIMSFTRMHQEAFNLDGIVSAASQSIGQPIGSLFSEWKTAH